MYRNSIETVARELMDKNGSFDAKEVYDELHRRGLASPLDTILDIHKELTELFGPAGRK